MQTRWLSALLVPGFVLGLVLDLGRTPVAAAQPRRGDNAGPAERPPPADPARGPDRREQIKKKVRALRAYTLTDELALDEQTAARLFPVMSRYDDDFDRLLEQRVEVQRRLRRADALKDARAIERLIDEAVANQRGFWDLQDKRLQALRKILTPAQIAKLLIVLPAVERRIENQLRKAIVQRRPGSTVDDDDDQEPDERAPPPRRPRRREAPLAPRGQGTNAPGNTLPCDPSVGPCR
jgi:Spy/CpxP family protein refolding chaperone